MVDDQWLAVGLGNPGPRYADTRHNVGFWVIDALAREFRIPGYERRFDGEFASIHTDRGQLLLLKPLTFMNLSGRAVRKAVHWYKLPLDRVLIIHDDMDLPLGVIRLRQGGSAAGHHGVESVISELGSDRFARLRVGIGRPAVKDEGRSYVLSPFPAAERPLAERVTLVAAQAVLVWHREGLTAAMNRFNGLRIRLDECSLAD